MRSSSEQSERMGYRTTQRPKSSGSKCGTTLPAYDFYSPEEVWALVRAAATERDGAIYLVAAFAGLRRGELLALRWRDVDFERRSLRVRGNYSHGRVVTPKSGKGRAVPMAPEVAQALARLSQRSDFNGPDDLVFGRALGRRVGASACHFGGRIEAHAAIQVGVDGLPHGTAEGRACR
jgi:integrase